jgi:hypothetical protein
LILFSYVLKEQHKPALPNGLGQNNCGDFSFCFLSVLPKIFVKPAYSLVKPSYSQLKMTHSQLKMAHFQLEMAQVS